MRAGAFPLWLAPVQVCLLLVSETEQLLAYSQDTVAELRAAGIRAEVKSGAVPAPPPPPLFPPLLFPHLCSGQGALH